MDPSRFALWLDSACAGFDQAILGAIHQVQQSGADVILDPLARLLALWGKGGVCLILLGLVLLACRPTRKLGLGVLLALAIGAICTNVILKPLVLRPRPYADETRLIYQWWLEAGAHLESDASFPSGHTTAATAAMSALFFLSRRRGRWAYFLFAAAMALSRLYLVVHYPTDVLAGLLIGFGAGALGAYLTTKLASRSRRFP